MKSTLQVFWDLPIYPKIVSRVVALLHAFLGISQFLIGLAVLVILTENMELIDLLAAYRPALALRNLTIMYISLYGGVLVLLGLASLWVTLGNLTARPSIWLTTILVTGLHLVAWLSGASASPSVFLYLMLLLAAATVVLYVFDKRIKAHFQRGPLANQYAQWLSDKHFGKPVTDTPWEHEYRPPTKLF